MTTTEVKKRIILNFLNSTLTIDYRYLRDEVEKHVIESPDEIKLYEQEKELDRIKFGDR